MTIRLQLILIVAVITQLFVTPLAYSEVTAAQQADALRELRQWYDAERSRLHAAEGQSERWRQAQLIRDALALSVRLADDYAAMDAVPAGGDAVWVGGVFDARLPGARTGPIAGARAVQVIDHVNPRDLVNTVVSVVGADAGFVVPDWESREALANIDPLRTPDAATWAIHVADAHAVLDATRAGTRGAVGLYGIPVLTPTHYTRIRLGGGGLEEWQEAVRALAGAVDANGVSLADKMDVLAPTLYLPEVWRARWPEFRGHAGLVLTAVVAEGRRLGKPVVPFIRPHGFVDAAHWREWRSMVEAAADGVIIWESEPVPGAWYADPVPDVAVPPTEMRAVTHRSGADLSEIGGEAGMVVLEPGGRYVLERGIKVTADGFELIGQGATVESRFDRGTGKGDAAIRVFGVADVVIEGVTIIDPRRAGDQVTDAGVIGVAASDGTRGLRLRGVTVQHMRGGMDIQGREPGGVRDVVIDGCSIEDSVNADSHVIGLFAKWVDGLVVTDHRSARNGRRHEDTRGKSQGSYLRGCSKVLIDGLVSEGDSYAAVKVRGDRPGEGRDVVIRNVVARGNACAVQVLSDAAGARSEGFDAATLDDAITDLVIEYILVLDHGKPGSPVSADAMVRVANVTRGRVGAVFAVGSAEAMGEKPVVAVGTKGWPVRDVTVGVVRAAGLDRRGALVTGAGGGGDAIELEEAPEVPAFDNAGAALEWAREVFE